MIQQITIIGTGLIGGSIALGLKKYGFAGRVIGCDRQPVLDAAIARGAIDSGSPDAAQAVAGSDVVVLATPVGAIIDLIERLGPVLPPHVLLTDVGSTKRDIIGRDPVRFLELTARVDSLQVIPWRVASAAASSTPTQRCFREQFGFSLRSPARTFTLESSASTSLSSKVLAQKS